MFSSTVNYFFVEFQEDPAGLSQLLSCRFIMQMNERRVRKQVLENVTRVFCIVERGAFGLSQLFKQM